MHARCALAVLTCASACGHPAPAAAPPRTTFASLTGDPAANDRRIIKRVVEAHRDEIRACYAQALLEHPGISGRVEVEFVIGLDGHVQGARATGLDEAPTVAPCVADAISKLEFPKPKGGDVNVTYPFTFRPTS